MTEISELPGGAERYRTTEVFDDSSLPAGLRRQHSTKSGVYAVVRVVAGRLRFRFLEPEVEERELGAGDAIVAAPNRLHEVVPGPGMQIVIEFWRLPKAPTGTPSGSAEG